MNKILNIMYILGFSGLLHGCLGFNSSGPVRECVAECTAQAKNTEDLDQCVPKCCNRPQLFQEPTDISRKNETNERNKTANQK